MTTRIQRKAASIASRQEKVRRLSRFHAFVGGILLQAVANQKHNDEFLPKEFDVNLTVAEGNAVKVVPIHAELTTQEAADMLNVSRPHLVKLLESGALAFHKTGKHRRIRFADLMVFKTEQDRASAQAMEALAKQAQELQLGYE